MDRESARVVEHVDALLDPVQRAVEATVAVAQLDRESTRASGAEDICSTRLRPEWDGAERLIQK